MGATQSIVQSDQSFNLTDVERGNYRLLNDTSTAQITGVAADWTYQALTATGNTLVKTGAGQFHGIFVGTAAGTAAIYDGISAAGTPIIAAYTLVVGFVPYDVSYSTGLFIVLSGAAVATAIYR